MNEDADPAEVRDRMWEKLAKSPFVMVTLIGADAHAEPLTAQLDEDVEGKFWFYTRKDNRIAPGGPAMVQFVSKDHKDFACIRGNLDPETDQDVPLFEGLIFDGPSDGSTVRGLSLTRFTAAIELRSDGNHVLQNWIGLGVEGFAGENTTGVLVTGDGNAVGRRATVTTPDQRVTLLPLNDDGAHNDGESGDGVYGSTYTAATGNGDSLPC